MIPLTIIFDAKKMNHAWTGRELPGTKYGCSESGWITTDLFESWLIDHFLICTAFAIIAGRTQHTLSTKSSTGCKKKGSSDAMFATSHDT